MFDQRRRKYDFNCLEAENYHNTSAGMLTWLLITTFDRVIALPGVWISGIFRPRSPACSWVLDKKCSLAIDILGHNQCVALKFYIALLKHDTAMVITWCVYYLNTRNEKVFLRYSWLYVHFMFILYLLYGRWGERSSEESETWFQIKCRMCDLYLTFSLKQCQKVSLFCSAHRTTINFRFKVIH